MEARLNMSMRMVGLAPWDWLWSQPRVAERGERADGKKQNKDGVH